MNLLKKAKRKLRIWIASELFKLYYPHYFYPFETANDRYMKMTKEDKLVYAASVDVWVRSKAFKSEHEEMVRAFYQKLALESNDEVLTAAYRMTLIFMRDYEKRLLQFSKLMNK